MLNSSISAADTNEAKLHLTIALDEMRSNLPKTHEDLVERMRDYFEDQKIEVFSRVINAVGEPGFRDFIAETVIETGLYKRCEDGQVRPIADRVEILHV